VIDLAHGRRAASGLSMVRRRYTGLRGLGLL